MTDAPNQVLRDQSLYEIALNLCGNSDGKHRAWKDWEQLKKRLLKIEEIATKVGEKEIAALAYVAFLDFIEIPK